jgi:hypothetical protein
MLWAKHPGEKIILRKREIRRCITRRSAVYRLECGNKDLRSKKGLCGKKDSCGKKNLAA